MKNPSLFVASGSSMSDRNLDVACLLLFNLRATLLLISIDSFGLILNGWNLLHFNRPLGLLKTKNSVLK